jgi:hypothetical protein
LLTTLLTGLVLPALLLAALTGLLATLLTTLVLLAALLLLVLIFLVWIVHGLFSGLVYLTEAQPGGRALVPSRHLTHLFQPRSARLST